MQQRNGSAFILSVSLHIAVLLLLIVSFEFSSQMPVLENINNNSKIISAVAMNMPMTQAEPTPPPPPSKAVEEPKKPQKVVPPKPVPLQKQVELPTQKAIALKKEEHKKQLSQQKAVIEKQLLADLQKQKKKMDKHKALEQAMEKELREQAEKSLQQQLLHEQRRAAGAKSLGIVNKYKALILQAISDRWLVPSGVDKRLSSELLIRLAPGGVVLDVQITRSSGDVSLDRSARDAVFKASPLPVPENTEEFNQFRQFVLKVKPQDIITNNA